MIDNEKDSKLERINFQLDIELSNWLREIKEFEKIGNNVDMIKNLISEKYRSVLKEKKELGLTDKLFSE